VGRGRGGGVEMDPSGQEVGPVSADAGTWDAPTEMRSKLGGSYGARRSLATEAQVGAI